VFAGPQGLDHRAFRNRVLIVKKIVLAVLLALGPASAFAADLPARTYAKASVAGPAYNWSGFYFGANGGYGFQDQAVNHSANNEAGQIVLPVGPLDILPQSPTLFSPRGAVGGAQAGYNRQFDRNWLVGVEADFDASWIRGSGNTNYKTFAGAPAIISADEAIDWFGTVRARLGSDHDHEHQGQERRPPLPRRRRTAAARPGGARIGALSGHRPDPAG